MIRQQDVKLETELRDAVSCPKCKVDVHTFFGDEFPTIVYHCLNNINEHNRCKCDGRLENCPILCGPKINEPVEVTNKYAEILNKLEKRIELEEKKYSLTEREQMFADAIKEMLNSLSW